MKMKRLAILLLGAALGLVSSCSDQQQTGLGQVHPDSTVVNVAVLPTMDCLPIFLASDHGMFQRAGVLVKLAGFTAQMDADTAFTGGSVQAMATDLVRAENLRRQGVKLDYLTATDARWQLLTSHSARIKQLAQLYDKKLAMTRYSATDMLGDLIVDSARLGAERVFRIQINDLNIRLQMLQMDIMDAMLLPEPQATAARNLQGYVLLDASEAFDLRLGVIATRDSLLTENQRASFCKAYNEACDSINEHGLRKYGDILARRMGVSRHTLDSLPEKLTFQHAKAPRERDVERASEWLNKRMEKVRTDQGLNR